MTCTCGRYRYIAGGWQYKEYEDGEWTDSPASSGRYCQHCGDALAATGATRSLAEAEAVAAMWEFAARKMVKTFLDEDGSIFKQEARDRWFDQILSDLQADYKAGRS